jgi:lysozyme family protein
MSTFDRAFDLVIGAEGGYVNDPKDPGGETNFGISKRAYPTLDIKNLTIDDAKDIYERDYWRAASCDRLPDVVAVALFDSAVNQGIRQATRMLQRALSVNDDGVLGSVTIAAANKGNQNDLLISFCAERALHYASLSTFDTYGRGWMRRLFHVARVA